MGQVRHREASYEAIIVVKGKVVRARIKGEEEHLRGILDSKNWYQLHGMNKREKSVKITMKKFLQNPRLMKEHLH